MRKYDWSKELNRIFQQVEMSRENITQNLKATYTQRGLAWNDQIVKNLSGDIHTKCLGACLKKILGENGVETSLLYEVTLRPTMLRADILIGDRIDIESKAQGIFRLEDLKERWLRLNQKRPDLIHILVSWHENLSYVGRIREFMPESQHYYFHNLSNDENQPQELERLIKNMINWLRETRK